jgi:hypothetical protein
MSRIPLKQPTNIKFYTQYTHPTLICRGTDARTDGRTENIYSIFRDKLLLLGEHLVIVHTGPTAIGKSNVAALLCLPRLALELSIGHHLAWEGDDEVEEEEEEEHAEDGTNNKLVNPAADDGARHDGGSGHCHAAAITAVAAVAVWLGHVVSADLVQAYYDADVGSNMPTDIKLQCTPHHLINVVDPPSSSSLLSLMMSSYRTIQYSIHEEKYSKYDHFAYIGRNSIVQKNCSQ